MIAFTGPFSDINFGDYAMLVNNVFEIEAEELTLFVYERPFVEKIAEHYFADRTVTLVDVEFSRDFSGAIGHLTPAEIISGISNYKDVEGALEKVETLYVSGGGYFNSLWTQPHRAERLLKILAPALVAASMNIPVVLTANGFGPFRGDLEFFASMFGFLQGARFGVRDAISSPFWLSQVGIRPDAINALPDDLLFINERLTAETSTDRDPYILLETYLPVEYIERNMSTFAEFVQAVKSEHCRDIVFLPFNLGPGGMNQGRLLGDQLGIEVVDISEAGYLSIEAAIDLVRGADLMIASRYHAVILALSQRTPIVSVLKDVLGDKQYYHGKNVGALQRVFNESHIDLRDYVWDEFPDALDAVRGDFDGIVRRQLANYEGASKGNLERLLSARRQYFREAH